MDYSKFLEAIMHLSEHKPTRKLAWAVVVALLMYTGAHLVQAIAPGGLV